MVIGGMRSAAILRDVVLPTTNPDMGISIATTDLMIDTMIGLIIMMGIVGVMMVGAARTLEDLVMCLPLGDLVMMFSLSLRVDLGVQTAGVQRRPACG